MVKRGFVVGIITMLLVLAASYFARDWSYVYYISGTLGLMSFGLSLGYFIDKLILGNKSSFFSKKETRKISRAGDSKRFLAMGVPNLIAAFIYLMF